MSNDADPNATKQPADATSNERREALIKLGKYAAYATPVIVASISAVHGQAPISRPPVPVTPSPPPPAPNGR